MGYLKEKTGWDIGDPIMSLGNVAEKVGGAIVSAVEGIGKTVEGILKDPLPTLLQVGGAMIGIPPYVTAAVITGARGGNLEDIAKSAAVSYISSQAMSGTNIGKTISDVTKTAGQDFTNSMMENFSLPPDTAIAISKAATASLNSSIIGGVNAAISGKSVMDGITSGFTSGLIYSSTNSYFDSLNKDPNWGFSPKTLDLMKGASSSALNSIVSGKGDPSQAVGNYIASAFIGMGESKLKQAANEAWVNLTTDTDAAKAAQDKYITAKAELDSKANEGEALRKEINADSAAYQSTITNQYNPFKASYDKLVADSSTAVKTYNDQKAVYESNMSVYNNYAAIAGQYGGHYEYRSAGDADTEVFISYAPTQQSFLNAANAAAAAANAAAKNAEAIQASALKLYEDNKPMIDGLTSGKAKIDQKVADFQAIKTDIENPSIPGSTAANLKAASDVYQTKYDAWSKTKAAADRSAEGFTKALAQVATRDATIDALNTGAIKVTGQDADNNWSLSNGMKLTSQGKFVQDGKQLFDDAAGIPQKAMDFTANDGSNVDFGPQFGRLLSWTDVAKICKRDYGFEPTSDEIDRLAGSAYTATGNPEITALADQKATAAFRSVTGTDPTADELAAIKKTNNVVGSAISLAKTGDADPWGDLEGAMLKAAEGEPVKFTDAQLTDMVRKGQVFEGGDYSTKQDAANAARLAGYTQFEYDNGVYTMQPGGPTEKALFQSVIDMQPNKKAAFSKARELLGADKEFPYQGTTYTTAFWKPTPQPDAEIIGDGSVNASRAGTRVGLPVTTTEGLSYLTDQEKSVNQRIKEAYTGSTLSKIIGTPDDAVRTLTKMKDVLLTPGQGVVQGVKGLSDFYGIVTGNINNPLSQSMQGVLNNFDELTSNKTKNTLKTIQALVGEAAKDGQGSAAWETLKQAVLNPETALMTVGSSLGSFFPALAASAPLVAAGVPAAIATGAFIALNAASQGGSSGQEALEYVAKQLMNDPTVSMEHALEATIMAGRKAGIPAAAISAVINSMPMGRALENAMLKVSKSSLGRGVGSEILTEIPDETLAKIFSNYASGQDLSTGLGQTVANAAIGAAGAAGAVHSNQTEVSKLSEKVSDLVKSGEISPSAIANLKNEVSNLIGNVNYGIEPTLDLMSDQFFSGVISQEVAGELSLSGLSPEQIAQNLPAAVAHVESGNRIDPTFVDQFFTDDAEARQIASRLGYANPSPEVIKSLTGSISEVDAQAKLDEFLSGMTAFESGKPIGAAAAQEMVKDLGLSGLSDSEAISLATKIVQSVPADKLSEPKMTPEQVRSIIDEIIVANPTLTEVQVGKIVNDAIAKIPAGVSTSDISSLVTTAISNIPKGLSIEDVSKVVTDATKNLTTKLDTEKAISDAIGKIKLPAGITPADVTSAIKTYMTQNPGLSLADVAGKITESTKGLATDTSVQNAISTALNGVATTADVNAAISNIKFPAGLSKADVAEQIKEVLKNNPGLSAADVTKSIAAYMTANPGLTAADVGAAITNATKNLVTSSALSDALANSAKDVKDKFDTLNQAQKNAVDAQVQQGKDLTKAINDASSGLQANIDALSGTVKTQYDSLTQAQKDAIADQVQQGKDLNKAITDSASGLQTQITGLSSDVQAKYDALTQAQKDAVATQVQQGKDLTKAITDSATGLQANINALSGTVKSQYDSLTQAQKDAVASQVQQGKDLTKAIADSASGLQTQITGLSEDSQAKYNALTQGQKDIVAAQAKQGIDVNAAIAAASKLATEQVADVKKDVGALTTDVQAKYDLLDQGQKDIVATQVKLGVDVNKAIDDAAKATTQQITEVKTGLSKEIGEAQSQFNIRVDDLVKQGLTYQTATQKALDEIKATQTAEAAKAEAAAKSGRAAKAQAGISQNLQQAVARVTPSPGLVDTSTPGFANIGLKTSGEAKFEGPLEQYMKMLSSGSYAAKPQESQQTQQVAPVQDQLSAQQQPTQGTDYFAYGQQSDIDLASGPGTQMLYSKAGGLATPLFAGGGTTRHGRYAGGGLNVVQHAGKARIDFRTGNAVTGPGDGQSDDIPAMLADGEFVFPADVVAALGNGSTKAGSDKLYDMMHSIRAYHRSAKPQDLPPPAKKSPLDYLKKPARKVRR